MGNPDGSLGYGSPTIIKTDDEDFTEKLHPNTTEQEEDTPLTIPKVVEK